MGMEGGQRGHVVSAYGGLSETSVFAMSGASRQGARRKTGAEPPCLARGQLLPTRCLDDPSLLLYLGRSFSPEYVAGTRFALGKLLVTCPLTQPISSFPLTRC